MPQQLAFVYEKNSLPQRPRLRICDMPLEEQPRYRLGRHGASALSHAELLALILGSSDALDTALELLLKYGSLHRLARGPDCHDTRKSCPLPFSDFPFAFRFYYYTKRKHEPKEEMPGKKVSVPHRKIESPASFIGRSNQSTVSTFPPY